MTEKASLLLEPSELSEGAKLAGMLRFFGIPGSQWTIPKFLSDDNAIDDNSKFRLLCSAGAFLKLAETLQQKPDGIEFWQKNVHSALVCAAGNSVACELLARRITSNPRTSLVQLKSDTEWTVSDKFPEFCKSMSGIRVVAAANGSEAALVLDESKPGTIKIIFSADGAALVKLDYHGVPVFLATTGIIDIHAGLASRDFDIRRDFLSAVPVVMYVKWAFPRTCWQAPENSACLVIDDPLLKPRYGFLDFQLFRDLMQHHNFSTSIAFIPWNWRRSAAKVIRLFKENPERFSLSIHGCDHTGGEFGIQHRGRLAWKAKQATERMARHESKTGIPHDPVMVFPQGVFSEAAVSVLKHSDFIGIVNSEVISSDPQPRKITVADFWNVGVMSYNDFPIFTRRYPLSDLGNFAFDILLGKPCIVVVHHNDCHDRCRPLVEFIDRLNALHARLVWRNLAEVVRHSYRQRELSPGVVEIEMYGTELRVGNSSAQRMRLYIRRGESNPSTIREIRAGAQPVSWTTVENQIAFEIDLNPGENQTIKVKFAELPQSDFKGESLRYQVNAMVRRYLSELRDNYVTRKSFSA